MTVRESIDIWEGYSGDMRARENGHYLCFEHVPSMGKLLDNGVYSWQQGHGGSDEIYANPPKYVRPVDAVILCRASI